MLLVRFEFPDRTVWALPGGGLEPGESHVGGSWFVEDDIAGQRERIYLVRTFGDDPAPAPDELSGPWMKEVRWWTRDEIDAYGGILSPRRLRELLHELDEHGPPDEPVDVGV